MLKIQNNVVEIEGMGLEILSEVDVLFTRLLCNCMPKEAAIFTAEHITKTLKRIADADFNEEKLVSALREEIKAHEK